MKIQLLQETDSLLICGGSTAIDGDTKLSDLVYIVCYKLGRFLRRALDQKISDVATEAVEEICGPVYLGPATA